MGVTDAHCSVCSQLWDHYFLPLGRHHLCAILQKGPLPSPRHDLVLMGQSKSRVGVGANFCTESGFREKPHSCSLASAAGAREDAPWLTARVHCLPRRRGEGRGRACKETGGFRDHRGQVQDNGLPEYVTP